MQAYKQEFIRFMLECEVLLFGDFVTKSGRKTPFFVNTGKYRTGEQIARLGRFYAESIMEHTGGDIDVLFGPAYKGIPLAVAAASSLYNGFNRNVAFCFNRKEAKDHGEGGVFIGHKLAAGNRVLIIEDVVTAGTSVGETVPLLKAEAPVKLAGLVVSVDRQERGKEGTRTALTDIRESYGMKTFAIVTMAEVVEYLHGREIGGKVLLTDEIRKRIGEYYAQYGGTEV
ncbi:MAG TPA: orotate phosphoribosyltransferase [bacterium]|nr:orotate phosphoribosyltransferase [bacterium]